MKKLLLVLALLLAPSIAKAQCNGIFQPNSYCGNNTASPRTPFQISGSASVGGPASSTVGDLALWNNTLGTLLKDQAPGAFTRTNDTNVTVTLGGANATALVNAMSITIGWTGQLAVPRGGTGLASGISGGIPYFNTTTSMLSSAAITGLVLGNGAGAAPTQYASTSCTNQFIRSLSALGVATCNSVNLTADVASTLPVANGGTGGSTGAAASINLLPTPVRAGDVLYWNGANWVTVAGNNSGTNCLVENPSGIPSFAACASGVVSSVNNQTGAVTVLTVPQGRLTLQSGVPVMITTQSGKTSLLYDCYIGNQVPYYTGSVDALDTIAACEATDAMVSGATAGQVVAGQIYDAWWVQSGANRICLAMSTNTGGGGGWAADAGGSITSRGTGYTQLDRTTRPYITNKNSITNCFNGATNYGPVSANQATYLGTVYSPTNGQINYTFGSAASGGGQALFGVWNMYNRVTVHSTVTDNGASYTYNSATIRQARNNTGNQHQWVSGLAEEGPLVTYNFEGFAAAATTATQTMGIGLDSTTTFASLPYKHSSETSTQASYSGSVSAMVNAQVGFHTVSANEASDANANTFDGTSLNQLVFEIRM